MVMNALTTAALILLFLPFTLQRCHDELLAQKNCEHSFRGSRYQHYCDDYYKMHCYEVTDKLKSNHMASVHKISVKSGNITSLTSALFDGFDNVKSITISESDIASMESNTFLNLRYLESLNLTGNSLEILPEGLFNSTSLKTLDLSNNNISTIQHISFTRVTRLILHHNRIKNVSNLMATRNSLEILDLSYNNVKTIELSEKCANLFSLNAAHNELIKFTVIGNQSLMVNILDLSCNNLDDISSKSLYNLVTLSSLHLNNNPLFYTKNPPVDLFQNTLRLEVLNLSATGIQEIYVGTFSRLSSLKLLDLSQNNLTTLSKGIFHDLRKLTHLYLNDNHLTLFQYEGFTELAKISLNANLFTCDVLVDIANTLTKQNVDIIKGHSYDTKNILGMNCLDTENDSKAIINQTKFFSKIEQIMQQLLLEQENRSLALSNQQSKSDVYWRNLTQDYKGFLQTLQQNISDTLHKLANAFTTSQDTKTNQLGVGNYSLQQWKLLQTNFMQTLKSDRKEFLGAMRNSFDMLLMKLGDANEEIQQANTLRNVSYKAEASFYKTSSFPNSNDNISVTQGSNKALIVGIYSIFLTLVIGLVLLLSSKFKSCRNAKIKQKECNSLTNLQV